MWRVSAGIGLDFTRLFEVNFSAGELNASHPFLRNNIDLVAIDFRNDLEANIKGAPNKEGETTKGPEKSGQSSSMDSGVRGIIAVILGVLGVGAIVVAIMQFGGPALKNLGVNLPGVPQR